MRLLHVRDLTFKKFLSNPPPYIVLSHRWNEVEASLVDVEARQDEELLQKVTRFASYVDLAFPHIKWIWVDSCCIKQESDAELSEAVNRMFHWYRHAELCVAYLADVYSSNQLDVVAFSNSAWFTRGWTLQELLASRTIVFLANDWTVLGHKGQGYSDYGSGLDKLISHRTSIPELVLVDYDNSSTISIADKFRWMQDRQTLREEDLSYALFGICGVSPGANYGEGYAGARQRLLSAISEKERLQGLLSLVDNKSPAAEAVTTIPFQRDPDFVSRPELDEIQRKLSMPGRLAIVGLGGAGKSQLAIEYCYRTRSASPDKHILWLHASSADRLNDDLQVVAERLDIPGREDATTNVLSLVSRWLSDARNGSWLLVLDNADKADYLFEPLPVSQQDSPGRRRAPVQYLPTCNHGTILVTTRRHAVASQLVDVEDIIELRPSEVHSRALISAKLHQAEGEAVHALSAALGHIPLAITQATSYIRKRSPRCTIDDYLNKLRRSEGSQFNLLTVESNELRRDREEASNSILITWQISFEHILEMRKSAADLLALMSFFDHQGIPEILVRARSHDSVRWESQDVDKNMDDELLDFEDDIIALTDYCFLSVTSDGSSFEMHNLVQLAARLWLKTTVQQEKEWELQSLRNLEHAFPSHQYSNWSLCRELYPHAKLVLQRKYSDAGNVLQAALLQRASSFALTQGLHADAEAMASKCLELEAKFSPDQRRFKLTTARTVLAAVYLNRSDYEKAEAMDRLTLYEDERTLGPEHVNTLQCKENLALTLWKRNQASEAIKLTHDVMQARSRVLGPDNIDTLTSMSIYALFMSKKYQATAKQQRLCERVTEQGRDLLTSHDPKVLRILENLSSGYYHQQDLAKAVQMSQEVLEKRRAVLGPLHPATLRTMYDIAGIYRKQGRYAEAETLHMEVYKHRQAVFGPTHSKSWKSLTALAAVMRDARQYDRALEHYQRAVIGYTEALGADHVVTRECDREMRRMLRAIEREGQAQESILSGTTSPP